MNDDNDVTKNESIRAAENSDPDVRDEDSLLGSSVSTSGSSSDDLGAEAGLLPLEDENGNPRALGGEPVALDDTDETEAENEQ